MARLAYLGKNAHLLILPYEDQMQLVLQFLRENPDEKATTVACTYYINKGSVHKVWLQERNRLVERNISSSDKNKILDNN